MNKIKIVKDGIVRSINEKETAKWASRGYVREESVAVKPKQKAKISD